MSDVTAAIIDRLRTLEGRLAAMERRETTPATSSDTYNAAVANLLKSATDGGLRLDHLELGNVTSAAEGQLKTAGNVSVGAFLNLGPGSTLTVSAGGITATGSRHYVDTEGGAATDDLYAISGGATGDILVLSSVTYTRVTTLKDGTGSNNLRLAGDFALGMIMLMRIGDNWHEISRSNN